MTATTADEARVHRLHTPQFLRVDTIKRQTKRNFNRAVDRLGKMWRALPRPAQWCLGAFAFVAIFFLYCYAIATAIMLLMTALGLTSPVLFWVLYLGIVYGSIFSVLAALPG